MRCSTSPGVGAPFTVPSLEDKDEDELVHGVDVGEVIGVVSRVDYRITDPAAVLAAGRRAYLDVRPEDDEEDAAADVTDIGQALYQRAHAAGEERAEEALRTTPGLRVLGATRWFVEVDEPIGAGSDVESYPFHRADGSPFHPFMSADYVYLDDEDADGD
jgi:hypothetical protein